MNSGLPPVLQFCELVGKLKHLKRTGWVLRGIAEPETVASHMYRMAMLTFALKPEDSLDLTKCMKMALVHDLAESVIGDLTPHCGVSEEDKRSKEEAAMREIAALVPDMSGAEIITLFLEYENQSSSEAVMIKDIDKFDMIVQAFEYEKIKTEPGKLEEFFASTRGKFKTSQVKEWVEQLETERNKLLVAHATQ